MDSDVELLAEKARPVLQAVARSGELITYSELVDRLGVGFLEPGSQVLWDALDQISRESHAEVGVMLSAVVVKTDNRQPGNGFFELAEALGENVGNRADFFAIALAQTYRAFRSPLLS